jgi:hypothetical protein
MSKKTSMRLPAATVDQLQWLAEHRFGDNQTTAMVVAVDRLYRDESKDMLGYTLRHAVQEALELFRGWMDGAVVVRFADGSYDAIPRPYLSDVSYCNRDEIEAVVFEITDPDQLGDWDGIVTDDVVDWVTEQISNA